MKSNSNNYNNTYKNDQSPNKNTTAQINYQNALSQPIDDTSNIFVNNQQDNLKNDDKRLEYET